MGVNFFILLTHKVIKFDYAFYFGALKIGRHAPRRIYLHDNKTLVHMPISPILFVDPIRKHIEEIATKLKKPHIILKIPILDNYVIYLH